MNRYHDKSGRFASAPDLSRTYGTLEEGEEVDLHKEDTVIVYEPVVYSEPYEQIHNVFYVLWLVGTAVAVFISFFLGSLAYSH